MEPTRSTQPVDINGTFDIHECAQFLKIDEATVARRAKAGIIPGAKVGRAWVFLVSDLIEYLKGEVSRQTQERQDIVNGNRKKIAHAYEGLIQQLQTPVLRGRRRKPLPDLSKYPDVEELDKIAVAQKALLARKPK